MMKHFVYFLFVLGIVFLSSCTDSKSEADKDVISIPINVEEDRTLKMSDFIDSLRYIRLETNIPFISLIMTARFFIRSTIAGRVRRNTST